MCSFLRQLRRLNRSVNPTTAQQTPSGADRSSVTHIHNIDKQVSKSLLSPMTYTNWWYLFSFFHTGDIVKQMRNSPLGPTPYTIWWCHASGICCCLTPCWRLRVAIGTAPAQQITDQPLMALSEVTLSTHTSIVQWLLFFYIYLWISQPPYTACNRSEALLAPHQPSNSS